LRKPSERTYSFPNKISSIPEKGSNDLPATLSFVGNHLYNVTTHWQHPNHYGFFAGPSSTVAIAGDFLD